jgi:hypothetical protein
MADEFPGRPKILKGALAVYTSHTPGTEPQILLFQYNPDSVRRTLARRAPPADAGNQGGAKEDVLRAPGPPVETLTLTVALDATDQLAEPDTFPEVVEHGLHHALAALEMLLYPPSFRVQENQQLAEQGEVQVSPEELPLVLLVWGRSRVVPVQVTSFSVTEEAFDTDLNPIRAKVELGLKVLTYIELEATSLGRDAFFAYQRNKEELAAAYQSTGDIQRTRALLPGQSPEGVA